MLKNGRGGVASFVGLKSTVTSSLFSDFNVPVSYLAANISFKPES